MSTIFFYEFDSQWSRKRGFFTNVLSQLTGLETINDVREMNEMMTKVETGVLAATQAWKSGTSHFTAAFKLEKSRVDNVYQLLQLHRQSISSLQTEITNAYRAGNNRVRIMAKMINSLTDLTLQISELDRLLSLWSC